MALNPMTLWFAAAALTFSPLSAQTQTQGDTDETTYGVQTDQQHGGTVTQPPVSGSGEPPPDPERLLRDARDVFHQMRQDPDMLEALGQSRGIFIIPDYAAAALVVGGAGGEGVMLEHRHGDWSDPVFFNVGRVSLGLQAGVAVGSIAMLLMSDDAVLGFHGISNFSLDAEAGLTIVDWSAVAEATAGRGDVVLWSDMAGLLADVSIGATNINYDEEHTSRYYGERVMSPQAVLTGAVEDPRDQALRSEFAEFTGSHPGNH